jgi:excisionase family DNA binding protein
MTQDDRWMSLRTASAYADYSTKTLKRAIMSGKLKAVKAGKDYRVRKSSVDRWLGAGRV